MHDAVGSEREGSPGWSVAEVEFFGEHGDHAGDLLLLVEARVIRLGLEVPGHPVVHPGEDLHDLQLFAVLVQDGAEGLHKPRAPARVPPGIIAWNCGISEEKVSFHGDLMAGVGICVIDGPRVGLDSIIELRPSASLDEEEFGFL